MDDKLEVTETDRARADVWAFGDCPRKELAEAFARARAEGKAEALRCDGCGCVPPAEDDGTCGCHGKGLPGMLAHLRETLRLCQDELLKSEARHDEVRKLCSEAGVHHPAMLRAAGAREEREAIAAHVEGQSDYPGWKVLADQIRRGAHKGGSE